MDYQAMLALGLPLGIGLAAIGSGVGLGRAVGSAMEAIGRQPEAYGKIQTAMIIGAALIDPDGTEHTTEWKPEAARPVVAEAIAAGRHVIWIEDFNGALPDLDGVTYVDTGARGVLSWSDLPLDILE